MRGTRTATHAALACLGWLCLATVAGAQALTPFAGRWLLNQDASTYEPLSNRPDRRTMTIDLKGDELVVTTETTRTVNAETFTTRTTYTAKPDGREYPVPNSNNAVAFRRLNATTLERVARAAEPARETATWTLAGDGRTLTIVAEGLDSFGVSYRSTQVFERGAGETR